MKYIQLTRGKAAVVDDEDYERLSMHKWLCDSRGYARRYLKRENGKPRVTLAMHRVIADAPDGLDIDHINGDRLDNRRANLRLATRSQNCVNRGKQRGDYHSHYKGVTYHKRDHRWHAQISLSGQHTFLGSFDAEIDAAIAYNNAAIEHYKEFANLNLIHIV